MAASSARNLFLAFSAVMGLSLSSILLFYTKQSISLAFFETSAAFGALSLVGYTTKRDLTGMGSFLIMGVWGMLALSIVNMLFLHLAGLQFLVQVVFLGIFAGLIAFQTQALKMTYYQLGGNQEGLAVATNFGALNLYLDFINIFQIILSLFGGRR